MRRQSQRHRQQQRGVAASAAPWHDLEDGLRYRLGADPVSGTETIEIEHAAAYANGGTGPSAAVILTHGLGDSARGWASAALQLCTELPWTRWVLPSAPNSPVTLNGGMSMPSWYDIAGLTDRAAETCGGIEDSHATMLRLAGAELEALCDFTSISPPVPSHLTPFNSTLTLYYSFCSIFSSLLRHVTHRQETAPGTATPRLVMAGFSQGGAMSLYTALRWPEADAALPPPAGVLCMSGYLPLPFTSAEDLSGLDALRDLPVLLCHGDADPMVRPEWSSATYEKLDELGCSNVDHRWFKGLEHSVSEEELQVAAAWLTEVIPPLE